MIDISSIRPSLSILVPWTYRPWLRLRGRDLSGGNQILATALQSVAFHDVMPGRTVTLERLVDLDDVSQSWLSLECQCPVLYMSQDGRLDCMVKAGHFENGHEIIDELSRRYFDEKVVSSVLDARVGELGTVSVCCRGKQGSPNPEREKLHIWVLVIEPTFESAHCVSSRGTLGSNLVAYFEIECDVF